MVSPDATSGDEHDRILRKISRWEIFRVLREIIENRYCESLLMLALDFSAKRPELAKRFFCFFGRKCF